MDEYIKRDGVLSKFNIDDMMNVNGTLISLQDACETISNFPAADVVPVVRCEECAYHQDEETGMVYCPRILGGWVPNEFFCKEGKTRTNAHAPKGENDG